MAALDTTFIAKVTTILATWAQSINDFVWKGRNPNYVTSTNIGNAYTITLPTGSLYSSLSAGDTFTWKANATNTGAVTLTVTGAASVTANLYSGSNTALMAGDLVTGTTQTVVYDGTNFQLTSLNQKKDIISVVDFGAIGDGVTDATAAFTAAAAAVVARVDFTGNGTFTIAQAPQALILVPSGSYLLGSLVNTSGKNVIWKLDAGAVVTPFANLNGMVEREGKRISGITNGIYDYGVGFAVSTNTAGEAGAQICGYSNDTQLGTFTSRDSVAVFVENTAPSAAFIAVAAASYTASTIVPTTPLTADQVKLLRVGMMIDTAHATKYSGFITSWATNGTSITVNAWYLSPGSGVAATPSSAGTPGATVRPITKIWAHNANTTIPAGSPVAEACGFELGTLNNKAAPASYGAAPLLWGFDSVNLGTYKCGAAYIARNAWFYGFNAQGQDVGFRYDTGNGVGFDYVGGTGAVLRATDASGNTTYLFNNTAAAPGIEYGNQAVAGTPYIDWHSSGNTIDYDVRMIASGGTGSIGAGTLTINCGALVTNGQVVAPYFKANAVAGTAAAGEITYGATTVGTVGAAGGASALPATPLGYIIINVAGTAAKIPYYNT